MRNILIETKRLKIFDLKPQNACDVYQYRSQECVKKYQTFDPKSIEDVVEFITKNTKKFNVEGCWFQVGVWINNNIIGDIGINFVGPQNMQCEIGYTLDPSFQGNGYATEAICGVLSFLFDLGKHRIIASVDCRNEKSIKLLERIKFRKEAHFKESVLINNSWEDDVVYAILREEFLENFKA